MTRPIASTRRRSRTASMSQPRVMGHTVFFVAEDLLGEEAIFMVDLVEAGLIEP